MPIVLVLQVVNCWTREYQPSEEALLEGTFIGNSVRGGILDILGVRPLNGHSVVQSTSSWRHTIKAAWLGPKFNRRSHLPLPCALCRVEIKQQWNFKTSMLLRLCSAAALRYRLAPNYAQFKGVLRQVAAAAAVAAVAARRRRHLLHTKCSRGTIKHSAALGSVKGEEDPIHLLFIALLLNRLIKNINFFV